MKPAYIIADVTVTNDEQYAEYRKWSTQAMQAHGAEVLVRGGAIEVLEGDWQPSRLVVLKFADHARARAFYDSETYQHAKSLRAQAGIMRMLIVDGV
ncbi:DUF1330 domain-containing protein [Escherichia coli]|nr:DUF1330 domain-containing protein [Escherichia coli]